MARVILSEYEVGRNLLPPLCITCGQPAAVRFDRTVRVLDDPGRWGGLYLPVLFFSIYCLPPLMMVLMHRARTFCVKIPVCPRHLHQFRCRERILLGILITLWVLVALVIDAGLAAALYRQPGWFCVLAAGIALFLVAVDRVVAWRTRRRAKKRTFKFNLPFVHPAFVAALAEDRARDRVLNEDRRAGFGDIRDDFDDQAG